MQAGGGKSLRSFCVQQPPQGGRWVDYDDVVTLGVM